MVDLLRKIEEWKREVFMNICEIILKQGYFQVSVRDDIKLEKVISYFSEKEILFFDPMSLKVTGNSRIYEKGMEILVRSR